MSSYKIEADGISTSFTSVQSLGRMEFFRRYSLELGNKYKLKNIAVRILPAFLEEAEQFSADGYTVFNVVSVLKTLERQDRLNKDVPNGVYEADPHEVRWQKMPTVQSIRKGVRELVNSGLIEKAGFAGSLADKGLISKHAIDYTFTFSKVLFARQYSVTDRYLKEAEDYEL